MNIHTHAHIHAGIDIYKFITIYCLHICIYKYALNSYRNLHSIHSNICSIIATCLTSNCGNGGAKDGHIPQPALESDHGCLPWLRSGHHWVLKGFVLVIWLQNCRHCAACCLDRGFVASPHRPPCVCCSSWLLRSPPVPSSSRRRIRSLDPPCTALPSFSALRPRPRPPVALLWPWVPAWAMPLPWWEQQVQPGAAAWCAGQRTSRQQQWRGLLWPIRFSPSGGWPWLMVVDQWPSLTRVTSRWHFAVCFFRALKHIKAQCYMPIVNAVNSRQQFFFWDAFLISYQRMVSHRVNGEPIQCRWLAVHALVVPTVFFLGAISSMQFIQR